MRWPVDTPVVTSAFAPSRPHPILGVSRAHLGTDFGVRSGVILYVITDGVVAGKGLSPTGGNWVSVDFTIAGIRYRAVYMHMQAASPLIVGRNVREGDVAGVMGETGLAKGRHLHFEIRVMPADTPIDPELFLRGGSTAGVETPERPPVAPIEEDDMQADEREALMAIKAALLDGIPQTGMAKGRLDAIYDATETVRSRLFTSTLPGGWDAFDELIRNTRAILAAGGRVPGVPVDVDALAAALIDGLGSAVAADLAKRLAE